MEPLCLGVLECCGFIETALLIIRINSDEMSSAAATAAGASNETKQNQISDPCENACLIPERSYESAEINGLILLLKRKFFPV